MLSPDQIRKNFYALPKEDKRKFFEECTDYVMDIFEKVTGLDFEDVFAEARSSKTKYSKEMPQEGLLS